MNITYIASSGHSYSLSASMFVHTANFHEWSFEAKTTQLIYGERVSYFKRSAATFQTVLTVYGGITQRKALLNALHDDFEADVRNLTPGRVIWGNWYCDCFIKASKTEPHSEDTTWTQNTVDIYVPSGFWIREESHTFERSIDTTYPYLDYTYDYSYDYAKPAGGQDTWITDSPFPAEFEMGIYGPCVNPRVVINGYPYVVYATIGQNETLVINSRNRTVMCGSRNLFDARGKEQSVFEKIPPGSLAVSWGGFSFKLTLYEERSEPKW